MVMIFQPYGSLHLGIQKKKKKKEKPHRWSSLEYNKSPTHE